MEDSYPLRMRPLTVLSFVALATSVFADENVRHVGPVTGIDVNGDVVYSCSQAGVFGSDAKTKALERVVEPGFRIFDIVAVGDDQLAMSGGIPGKSGSVALADLPSGKLTEHEFTKDLVYSLALSPSRKLLAAACANGEVVLIGLPLDTSKLPAKIHRHTAAARTVAVSPDGRYVASGGLDGVVLLTPIDGSGSIAGETRVLQEHTAGVECLTFSPDGKRFASGACDSKVRLHSIDGRLIRTYAGIGMENEPAAERVPARLWAVAWGKEQLVAGTSKGTLYRLSQTDDTWTRLESSAVGSIYALAFDSDGSLWIGSESSVILK
jgi:WD40 repeat protein